MRCRSCGRVSKPRIEGKCGACWHADNYPPGDTTEADALKPGEWRFDPIFRVQRYIPYGIGA